MPYLPDEIIREILRRLPVKPLLRCRSVSKKWRSMIDSKSFIQLQIIHRTLLVDTSRLHHVDLDSFKLLQLGDTKIEPHSVAGSCNGLVLLVPKSRDIFLWNPSIRKLHKLPEQMPLPIDRFTHCHNPQLIFALGYDTKNDDYKVFRVIQADFGRAGKFKTEATIYSLRSNSWKRLEDFPYLLSRYTRTPRWGACLNGALHTTAKHGGKDEVIMAFDLEKEEHHELLMPRFGGRARGGPTSVEVLGGFLAAVGPGKKNSTEVWLMKEYGVKKSWMKLLKFVPPTSRACCDLRPLAYSKGGDEVLLSYDGTCLNWYNLKKKTVTFACVDGLSASFDTRADEPLFKTFLCVGSLVSPCRPKDGEVKKKEKEKGKEIIRKKRDDFLSSGFKLKL